jgi:outer membrane receptor protein involved in Fe transport
MKFSQRFVFLSLVLLVGVSAFAQGTGTRASLSGTVTTEGKPLPGATVTISSPALQGTRTAITGEGGGYNFPSLPPGAYTVTMELEGLQKITRKVTLQLANEAHADADLKVSAIAEAITVTAAAPAVLETTSLTRNFDQATIRELPIRRNIRDTVLLAPGVNSNGPNNQMMLSGAPSYDNLFLVNGVVVNENLRGQPHDLFIEDAIQETTIITGGVSAEYGRFTGGVVSTLTKSGGNEFTGSIRDSETNPKWIAKSAYTAEADHPNKLSQIYEGTLGGYVLKDHLWFFGAGRKTNGAPANGFNALASGVAVKPNFAGIQFLNTLDQKRYEGKVTGNVFQKHSIVASYLDVKTIENNNFFAPIYDQASIVTQRMLPNSLKALAYNGVLTNSLLIEGQISQKKFAFVHSGGLLNDRIGGTWIQDSNARFNAPVFCGNCTNEGRNNDSGSGKATYYLNTKSLGNHSISGGLDSYKETRLVNNNQSASNFTSLSSGTAIFLPGDATPYPHFDASSSLTWRPILLESSGSHLNTTGVFVNDKWDFNGHWSFNVGFRYDKNHALDATGNVVSDDHAVSPRLGAIWDITGTGKSRVNASYAKYVTKIVDGNAGGAGNAAGTPASFTWGYGGPEINKPDGKGGIVGTPVSPQEALKIVFAWLDSIGGTNNTSKLTAVNIPGFTTKVLGSIPSPDVNEIILGFGQQMGRSGYAKVDLIDRKWHNFYGRAINQSTGQAVAPNGTINDLGVLVSTNSIKRTYQGAQVNFGWHPQRWSIGGGYTWSKLKGNDISEQDGTATSPLLPYGIYYPEYLDYAQRQPMGYLLGDERHRARVWAGYDMPSPIGNLNFSVIQTGDSGRPYSAIGTIDASGTNANFRYAGAPVKPSYYGTPTGTTPTQLGTSHDYFFSSRGQYRTPSVFSTDLAVNYELPISRVTLFAQGQMINVFNNSKVNNLVSGQFDTTIRTSRTNSTATSGLSPFNPFKDAPIECPQNAAAATCLAMKANWQKGPLFGTGLSKDAFQTPRTYRLAFGARF